NRPAPDTRRAWCNSEWTLRHRKPRRGEFSSATRRQPLIGGASLGRARPSANELLCERPGALVVPRRSIAPDVDPQRLGCKRTLAEAFTPPSCCVERGG